MCVGIIGICVLLILGNQQRKEIVTLLDRHWTALNEANRVAVVVGQHQRDMEIRNDERHSDFIHHQIKEREHWEALRAAIHLSK